MDLFHKLIDLVDKNAERIPEGDYVDICNVIKDLRERVKPPSFLLNQNDPLWVANGQLPSDADTIAQRDRELLHQQWREVDEEVMYPGLDAFLNELHQAWAGTDDHVESDEDENISVAVVTE
jgi:hypothetical protein